MRAITFLSLTLLTALAALTACGKPQPPTSPSALTRPVITLTASEGHVEIPHAALVSRGGVPGVFVLNEANQARFRMVRTGKPGASRIEILSGLSGRETLVAGDLAEVRDGSRIAAGAANR